MARKPKTTAERLADAAIKIARANHYFVGFDAATTDGISFDDYSDAYQLLIDRELKAIEREEDKGNPKARNVERLYDLAMGVLGAACYRQHNAHLTR